MDEGVGEMVNCKNKVTAKRKGGEARGKRINRTIKVIPNTM
jgi:hypothetical protein